MLLRTLFMVALLCMPAVVFAHSVSYSVFDFEETQEGVSLVVGIQPEMALMVVGTTHDESIDSIVFESQRELLAAYIESSVEVSQNGAICDWSAQADPIPDDALTLQAEGLTFRGIIRCPNQFEPFSITTDLFFDVHPEHKNLIRYRQGDHFVTFSELTPRRKEAFVDLRETFTQTYRAKPRSLFTIVLGGIGTIVVIVGLIIFLNRKTNKRHS